MATTTNSTPYPSTSEIISLFHNLEDKSTQSAFFERVSPNVDWTVMGTHPCAGRYASLQEFQQATFARLGKVMKAPGIQLMVRNVIGGGEQEWATAELVIHAEGLNGFKFDNTYAWCVRFDESGTIVEVRAYLDSWMVNQVLVENEGPETAIAHRAPVPQL